MKLFIQRNDETLELVTDELEQFDLSKTLARLALTDVIKLAITRIKVYNDINRPYTDDAVSRAIKIEKTPQ